jgi:hypothetical protein
MLGAVPWLRSLRWVVMPATRQMGGIACLRPARWVVMPGNRQVGGIACLRLARWVVSLACDSRVGGATTQCCGNDPSDITSPLPDPSTYMHPPPPRAAVRNSLICMNDHGVPLYPGITRSTEKEALGISFTWCYAAR